MNKSWGGNLIIGTLVERNVTNDNEVTETVDNSSINQEKNSIKKKKNEEEATENIRVTLPYKPKGEMFAVAETFQGGSRLQLICEDGKRRMGRIPGKLRRRMWVRENDLLIIVPWSFQDSKADVKFRYTPTQTSNLKRNGKIPEILDIY
tara:strand:+ start:2110 stop:2556 length:447 start_codon:yes stop_codon:yes gene_type:complete